MSEEATTNGAANGASEWVTHAQAVILLGDTSKGRKLGKLVAAGHVSRKPSEGGAHFVYSMADIDSWNEQAPDGEPGSVKLDAQTPELVQLLKASVLHTERSFALVHEPSRQLMKLFQDENAALRKRISELEGLHTELVRAREAALSEAHARDLADRLAEKSAARWDSAIETLKQTGPLLLAQLFETMQQGRDPRKLAALRLIERLTPERLSDLLASDALDAEERTLIQEVLREAADRKAQAAAATSPPGAPAAAKPQPKAPKAKRSRKGNP